MISYNGTDIKRMLCYFKKDNLGRYNFLWTSSVRLEHINTNSIMYDGKILNCIPSKIENNLYFQ